MLSPSFDVARLADVASEAHTVEIAPAELEGNVDLAGLLIAKMQHAAANAATRAGATSRGCARPAGSRRARCVCAMARRRVLGCSISTPRPPARWPAAAARGPRRAPHSAELDLVVLTGALEAMYGALHEEPDVVAIPLSFATLRTHQWSSQVFRACSVINSRWCSGWRSGFRASRSRSTRGFHREAAPAAAALPLHDPRLERPAIGNVDRARSPRSPSCR